MAEDSVENPVEGAEGYLGISLAAALVKVTTRMEEGAASFSWISCSARRVMTEVFPLPGPASTSMAPLLWAMARFCASFNFIDT